MTRGLSHCIPPQDGKGEDGEWAEWDVCRSLFDNHVSPSFQVRYRCISAGRDKGACDALDPSLAVRSHRFSSLCHACAMYLAWHTLHANAQPLA